MPSFIFVTCQNGFESAVKEEVAAKLSGFRFAYSRPGFLTFKAPEDKPLTPAFDAAWLHAQCQRRSTAIKQVIMDAQVVVGVGNIYASESLFHAGIRPSTAARRLSRPACARLVAAIKQVLTAAIAAGGSSLRDYVASDGELGYFQLQTRVYDREGLPCKMCATPIRRIVQGQRASFYCPVCQR